MLSGIAAKREHRPNCTSRKCLAIAGSIAVASIAAARPVKFSCPSLPLQAENISGGLPLSLRVRIWDA